MDINALFKSIVVWAQNDQRIHAVVLVGSHARRNSRPDSDVALCVLMDGREELLRSPSFFSRFGAMKRYKLEDWSACQSVRVWYQNGLEVEFGLVKPDWIKRPLDPGTMRVLQSGCKVLADKHGLFAGLDLSSAKEFCIA